MNNNRLRYDKTDNPNVFNMVVEKKIEEIVQVSKEEVEKYYEEQINPYNENVERINELYKEKEDIESEIERIEEQNEVILSKINPELEILDIDVEEDNEDDENE
jgi:hypothetical protein